MDKYLQNLVIILPVITIFMGGTLLIVHKCVRSWCKMLSNRPVSQRTVITQVDDIFPVNYDSIRNKLVEKATAKVEYILAEEFRKKQASRISQEGFNNLDKKQQVLDPESSAAWTEEKRRHQDIESLCRIPGMAPLTSAQTPSQGSSCPQKIISFAALWFEELQRSGGPLFPAEDAQRNEKLSVKDSNIQTSSKQLLSKVLLSDPSCLGHLESEGQGSVIIQDRIEETSETKEDDPSNELRLQQDLEMFLLTASSTLCRSMMAFTTGHTSGKDIFLPCDEKTCEIPGYGLAVGLDSDVFDSAAYTCSSTSVPKLLKGGAPRGDNAFEWRLDIEDKDFDTTPLDTPVRSRSPMHLCRGVQFQYEEHPPALSIIELNPGLGCGWRGPDWQDTRRKCCVLTEKGPGIYRRCKPNNIPCPSVIKYYKSIEAEAISRWEAIKLRYRRARQLAEIRAKLREEIRESEDWRQHLTTLNPESSSESERSEPDKRQRLHGKRQINTRQGGLDYKDTDRVRSLLSTSSSSSIDSDDSIKTKFNAVNSRCKRNHTHCYSKTNAPRSCTSNP